MPTFKDLKIYQDAIGLMVEVHNICKKLPREERFQLIDQAMRSSSSVSDNISEGYNAYYYKDKIHRFYDARKESGETQNHIFKMEKKEYIDVKTSQRISDEYQRLIKGINGYVNYLKRRRGDE